MKDEYGYISQVIGPVVDVAFDVEKSELPPIYTALKATSTTGPITCEI